MSDLLHGIHAVRETLLGGRRRPLELFVVRDARAPRLEEIVRLAQGSGVRTHPRERHDLDRLVGHGHHQGVVLRVEPFPFADLGDLLQAWRASGKPALFLLLDGLTDPHNFGAALRNADAAGCQGVIVPKDRSCPVTAVVESSAAGALAHLLLCQVTNLSRAIEELKEAGVWVYGLANDADARSLYATDLTGDVALVIGSEGQGMRPNVRRHCDGLLEIPMAGGVSSLNASAAAAVALYEAVRQRLAPAGKGHRG
jgi:23S rRNA (guanosine2251-2'-O)-methyltransferase